MNILAAPTHYYFTDNFGSEMYWSYKIIQSLDALGVKYYSVVWKNNITNCKLHNSKITELCKIEDKYTWSHNKLGFGGKTPIFIYKYFEISKKILKNNRIDIIHHILPFMYKRTFNPLPLLGYTKNIPFVIGPAIEAPTLPRNIKLSRFHNEPIINFYLTSGILKIMSPVLFKLFKETLNKCDKLITVNNYGRELYSQYIEKDKIVIIPQGIDLNLFGYDKNGSNNSSEITLLTVAPLVKIKGIEYLIESFKYVLDLYPNTILKIVGDGPELPYLKDMARKLKISNNIVFKGFIPHSQLSAIYKQCDIFVLPSLYGGSNAVLEAMASAKPVVTTDTIGLNEIVINAKTGYLVPPANSKELASAVIKLIENPRLREYMGINGRKKVEKVHDWNVVSKKYYNMYLSLI